MFEVSEGTPTGETDTHGEMIRVGDPVKRDDGFIGRVVFAFGAFRFDSHDGAYLRYNSSLIFSETGKKRFELIKGVL